MTEILAPDPPYPPDTKVNGYRPEIDWQVIRSSKTWRTCPPSQKNNLLRIWLESWNEVPSGSWENDEELIAAAVDMPLEDLIQYRSILLRGWKLHSDGRLYHPYITTMILEMIGKRMGSARRVQRWRAKQTQKEGVTRYNGDVTRNNDDVTRYNGDVTRWLRVGNATEQEQEQEICISREDAAETPRGYAAKKTRKFVKPTPEEVSKYCAERGNGINGQCFCDFYEAKGWLVGKSKTPMKDWQAAVRTWEEMNKKNRDAQPTTNTSARGGWK